MFTLLLIGIFFIIIFKEKQNSKSVRKLYILISSIILILQSGLRNLAVGSDTYAYYKIFSRVEYLSWYDIEKQILLYYSLNIGKDPGYTVFEKLVQYFTTDYQIFLLIIALIFFLSLGFFIFNNTSTIKDIILSYIMYSTLFYSFFSITGHRQTLATAIALLSFKYIKSKNFLIYVILILIASTLHKSALILIPFYFIARWIKYSWFYKVVLFLFPLLMAFKYDIANILVDFADQKDYEQYKNFEGAGTYTFTTMILLIGLFTFWRLKGLMRIDSENKYIIIAFGFALIFTPLTWVNPSLMRVVQYFSIFLLILLPMLLQSLKYVFRKNSAYIYIICIFFMFLLFMKSSWNSEYKFYWQYMELGDNY